MIDICIAQCIGVYIDHVSALTSSEASSLNNLAGPLSKAGRHLGAEPLSRRTVEILERVLGPDHPNTVTGRHNYEALLAGLGGG